MTMFELKYQLSPNGPYMEGGEGGERAGDEGSEAVTGGGTGAGGGAGGETGGGNGENGGKGDDNPPIIDPATGEITYAKPVEKIIRVFSINEERKDIEKKGEVRTITIKGTPSSRFSITIKDSSDCSILEKAIDFVFIGIDGVYTFDQKFPSIESAEGSSKSKETYTIKIIPAADVKLARAVGESGENADIPDTITLNQYADVTITLARSFTASDIGGNIAVTDPSTSVTGKAKSKNSGSRNSYALTVSESSAADGYFYVKNSSFVNNISTNTVIKKRLNRAEGETGLIGELILDPLTTRTETSIEGDDFITGDLQTGMKIYAKSEYTKKVWANLDKDGNILDYEKCKNETPHKIKLLNTNDLFEGMIVKADGLLVNTIKSVDCDKTITLERPEGIKKDTVLTFKKEWHAKIIEVISNENNGKSRVRLNRSVDIPNNTEIEFEDNGNVVLGNMKTSGGGSDEVVLTSYVDVTRFGTKSTTYTLNLDNIITRKPNAYDQNVNIKKNSSGYAIDMIKHDRDANRTSKTGTVVQSPSYGSVGSYNATRDTFTYTPNNGFTGEDSFTFTMSDGTNASEEKRIRITVK